MFYYSTINSFLFLGDTISWSGIYLGCSKLLSGEQGPSLVFLSSQQRALQVQAAPGIHWCSTGTVSHQAKAEGRARFAPEPLALSQSCPLPPSYFHSASPSLSTAFPDNPSVLSELCSTLSRLAVRNEFCQEVVDLGGLSILVALLANCSDHQVGIQSPLRVRNPLCLGFDLTFFSILGEGSGLPRNFTLWAPDSHTSLSQNTLTLSADPRTKVWFLLLIDPWVGRKVWGQTNPSTLSYWPLAPSYFLLGVGEAGVGVIGPGPDPSSAV